MTFTRCAGLALVIGALCAASESNRAAAAWDNVFQVCCHDCKPRVAYSAPCPQKVCTPCTSYRLRSQCNSVTSYVERCAMVPVTTLKQVNYQQPVVSYYYPPCPPPCPPAAASFYPPAPAGPFNGPSGAPSVEQIRENPPGVLPPKTGSDTMIPPPDVP